MMSADNERFRVPQDQLLKGKVAIVTGGTRGIGRAIALDLACNGADVAINYRQSTAEAEAFLNEIESLGRRGLAVQADVTSFSDAQRMVDSVVEKLGGLDILVNNAGMNRDGVIWKMTEEQWDTVMDIDLKGYFNYIRAAAGFGFRYRTPVGPIRLDFGFLIPGWQVINGTPPPNAFPSRSDSEPT